MKYEPVLLSGPLAHVFSIVGFNAVSVSVWQLLTAAEPLGLAEGDLPAIGNSGKFVILSRPNGGHFGASLIYPATGTKVLGALLNSRGVMFLARFESAGFLDGGGEMAVLIRSFDWSRTPLGPIKQWSPVLKTTTSLILRSPVPLVTLWGELGIMIYNDAYSRFAGQRHPSLLGAEVRKGWPEVADWNDNVMKVGLAGSTLSYRDQLLILSRHGAPEDVWLDLDYSPITDDGGSPVGVIAIVVETTSKVAAQKALQLNESRLDFLDRLARETNKSTDADAILATTLSLLGEFLGVSICAYADMEPDQDHFTIRGDWCLPGSSSIVGYYSLADFGQLAVANLRAGLPLVVNDNIEELPADSAATFQSIGIGATICMPLVKEGRLTALMAVHHKHPHRWTDHEAAMLAEVTERSWAHIERVRSDLILQKQEELLRLATGAAAIGTWDFNPLDGELNWDERCKALFGLPPDARVTYETFLAGLHFEDRPHIHTAVQEALETGGAYEVEYRTIGLTDNVERWISATGQGSPKVRQFALWERYRILRVVSRQNWRWVKKLAPSIY